MHNRCGGCSGAIERALTKAKADSSTGITDFTVDLKTQLVQVNCKHWRTFAY